MCQPVRYMMPDETLQYLVMRQVRMQEIMNETVGTNQIVVEIKMHQTPFELWQAAGELGWRHETSASDAFYEWYLEPTSGKVILFS